MKRLTLNERDLHALRIFKVVATVGGFSAAERILNMTTPTISRKIKDVEERLGATLCTRGPQGFALTKAGEVTLMRIQDVWNAVESILPAIDSTRDYLSGEVRVAILQSVIGNPDCHLSRALELMSKEAPKVRVVLHTISGSDMEKYLLGHEFHIIISASSRKTSSLRYFHLFDEEQRVYYHPLGVPVETMGMAYCPAKNIVNDFLGCASDNHDPVVDGLQSAAFFVGSGRYKALLPIFYAQLLSQHIEVKRRPTLSAIRYRPMRLSTQHAP